MYRLDYYASVSVIIELHHAAYSDDDTLQ